MVLQARCSQTLLASTNKILLLCVLFVVVVVLKEASFAAASFSSPWSLLFHPASSQNNDNDNNNELKLSVSLNVGLTLEHGDAVFDLGSTSSRINSEVDSCRVLRMAHRYGRIDHHDGVVGGADSRDELTVSSIIETLAQRMCSDEMDDDDGLDDLRNEGTGTIRSEQKGSVMNSSSRSSTTDSSSGFATTMTLNEDIVGDFSKSSVDSSSQYRDAETPTLNDPGTIIAPNPQHRNNVNEETMRDGDDSRISHNNSTLKDIVHRGLTIVENQASATKANTDVSNLFDSYPGAGDCLDGKIKTYSNVSTDEECWSTCQEPTNEKVIASRSNNGECRCHRQDECGCLAVEDFDQSSTLMVSAGFSRPDTCGFDTYGPPSAVWCSSVVNSTSLPTVDTIHECWERCDGLSLNYSTFDGGECVCHKECACVLENRSTNGVLMVKKNATIPENCPNLPLKACRGGAGGCQCDSKPLLSEGFFFSSTLSLNSYLLNYSSPQYQAACWVMYDDPMDTLHLSHAGAKLQSIQRYVLAVLYFSSSFASGLGEKSDFAVFLSSDSECEWTGVRCEKKNGSVITHIVLDNNDLSGTIPMELSHLRDLEVIDFKYNKFMGTVPEELGVLTSLKTLHLKGNSLTGSIPSLLFGATRLSYLNLSTNKLAGSIPEEICNLSHHIRYIGFAVNQLTGSVPDGLYELSSIESIWLGYNNLSSRLSTSIGNLQNLKHLWFESNNFSGNIPSEIGLMKSLRLLDLRDNDLEGAIPSTIGNLANLRQVFLQKNFLTGDMPEEICAQIGRYDTFTTLEVDVEDHYLEPEVNCAVGTCCTNGLKPTEVWIGDCPDAKIEIYFGEIYAYNYPTDTYIDAKWKLTQGSNNEVILSDSASLTYGNKYSVCVASTDCFKFQMTSDNFDEAAFRYSIKVNDVIVREETYTKTKVGDSSSRTSLDEIESYDKVIEFGYDSGERKLKIGSCNEIASICGKPINRSSNMIQIYNSALKISGKKVVDGGSEAHYDVTCDLIKSNSFNSTTFVQRYIFLLMLEKGIWSDNTKKTDNECGMDEFECEDGIVTKVDMTGKEINEAFLNEIGYLPKLEEFIFKDTKMSNTIPDIFANMKHLEHLNFAQNKIGGTIPGMPLRLKILDLSHNNLEGPVPSDIGNLFRLEKLVLNYNKLSVLSAIDSFEHKYLKEVRLDNNAFKGSLGIISIKNLEYFDVSANLLTGPLDDGLLNIPSLKHLNVSNNAFHGSIPSLVGNVSNVEDLDLSRNQLEGSIPDTFKNLTHLLTLYLQDNQLTGALSTDVAGLPSLTKLRVSHNDLRGSIPDNLMQSVNGTSGVIVHLHSNQFEGKAPVITSASYITDCGLPSAVQYPVTCASCTVCCNIEGFCQENLDDGIYRPSIFIILIMAPLFFFLLCLYVVFKNCHSWLSRSSLWKDINLVESIGGHSIYIFFFARNVPAWLIAFSCIVIQVNTLLLYLRAVNIQEKRSDWEYTKLCPSHDLSCSDEKATTKEGYFLLLVTMAAWTLEDAISYLKLFVCAVKWKSIDCFFVSTVLICLTVLCIYTSIAYNGAIATTDTELIMNAVVLLFVSQLDDRLYDVVRAINSKWLEKMLDEVTKVENCDGKGMISKIKRKLISKRKNPRNDDNDDVEEDGDQI